MERFDCTMYSYLELRISYLCFQELFYCHGIRKLTISDNEITKIPPAIASLINLEELDLSKNGKSFI
jgi:Leucine-rich repeat (LRR) protein